MSLKNHNKNLHLTLTDRQIIETGIANGSDKVSIAATLGKDPSTIGKEIKAHRILSYRCSLLLECAEYRKCPHERKCKADCMDYVPFKCKRRDHSPGACNGCKDYSKCRFNKYKYCTNDAYHEYREDLVGSRQGYNITKERLKEIGELIEPLVKKGQSLYVILTDHPEINLSEKTLYTYIEEGAFKAAEVDLGPMDLIRQVNRKLPKKKRNEYKPRKDRTYLKGRSYKDYEAYMAQNEDAGVVEMDTVYNDVGNGPFIQTFKFMKYSLLVALLHKEKTKEAMNEGVLMLERILGEELFSKEVEVLLTDQGSEFYGIHELEKRADGTYRFRLFYCDPMMSCQKGSLENIHTELRYILPKGVDLYALGLQNQDDLNLAVSNIDSGPKEKLNGKSPIELVEFLNPQLYEKLRDFGIRKIEKDDILLKPYLLKK